MSGVDAEASLGVNGGDIVFEGSRSNLLWRLPPKVGCLR